MPGLEPVHDEEAPEVSVVIPTLDAVRTLGQQLDALARQRTQRTFEVLVADNGSTDGTREVVAAYADRLPGLRWVDASARTGSNVARNIGTRAARADLVLLCDSDDEVDDDWLEAMASALEGAGGVGGRLEREQLNSDYAKLWGRPAGEAGIQVHLGFLPRPIGANAGFRRTIWEELGGFDEDYVRGGTETEFFWRLQLAGHTLADVPTSIVHYRMRTSFKKSVKQMYIWGRQHPMLYRDFRAHGMRYTPRDTVRSLRSIPHLVRLAARDRTGRLWLCREVAYRAGRVVGSYRYRVVYL
ncbi:glycosyltransferase [Pseudokineococcus sp. 5B2Z-1]|uniref:glycosyltransferase n=1 Tax=Pseudokineococcus sp. 5B2Z-1 TaxID=3132744 RepID=UPI0030AD7F2F